MSCNLVGFNSTVKFIHVRREGGGRGGKHGLFNVGINYLGWT